jgi:hypothetical protein
MVVTAVVTGLQFMYFERQYSPGASRLSESHISLKHLGEVCRSCAINPVLPYTKRDRTPS